MKAKVKDLYLDKNFFTMGDSMLLDSNIRIMSAQIVTDNENDDYEVELVTAGNVHVVYKGEDFYGADEMPQELLDLIAKGNYTANPDINVIENNWYELVFVCNGIPDNSEVIDLPSDMGKDRKEVKKFILDLFNAYYGKEE